MKFYALSVGEEYRVGDIRLHSIDIGFSLVMGNGRIEIRNSEICHDGPYCMSERYYNCVGEKPKAFRKAVS